MSTPALYAQISEKTFTAQVIDLARWYKWRVAHFRAARTKRGWVTPVSGDGEGFPDLLMLRADRAIAAELKSARGKPTPEQEKWLDAARRAKFEVYIWKPAMIDEIEEILK